MRILMFSSWFSRDFADSTLVNDLAAEFAARGHDVLVYAQDWTCTSKTAELSRAGGITIAWQAAAGQTAPRPLRTALKWALTSLAGRRRFKKDIKTFDPEWVVGFSPGVIHWAMIRTFVRANRVPSLMIQWDFFPFHHSQIGKFAGGPIAWITARAEAWLIDHFRYIGHMTPKNSDYFAHRYGSARRVQRLVIPIWGPAAKTEQGASVDVKAMRDIHGLGQDKVIAVFGGQLSKGRGIHNIIQLAKTCAVDLPECHFIIIGNGELRADIERMIAQGGLSNIELKARLPRSQYQGFIAACDIGIVSTEAHVDVPTFPSKSIDYFRNSIPILASVEASTDFSGILENDAHAGMASVAGDHAALLKNMRSLARDSDLRGRLGRNGRRYFSQTLAVGKVAERIEAALSGEPVRTS